MSRLVNIQPTVQQVANAISTVLNIETLILDENLKIIAGTGQYQERIGSYEAESRYMEEFLYKYLLRIGGTYVVDDIKDPLYGPAEWISGEKGEICCTISYREKHIGIIALVAFTDDQYHHLIDNQFSICNYLKNMATLLSSYLGNIDHLRDLNVQSNLLTEIVNGSPQGIIVIDSEGYITNANKKAESHILTKANLSWGLSGLHLDAFWPAATGIFLNTKTGFQNRELHFKEENIKIMASCKPVYDENSLQRVIIFFDDIAEVKKTAYKVLGNNTFNFDSIIGSSNEITKVKEFARNIAKSASTVLITGESGVGKEMFARAIYAEGPRFSAPFVTINCGAIPENLIESELFGYADGAFTGASKGGHVGKFEAANGGTIFIDEIAELSLQMQVKLLHVIQNRQIERIGSNKLIDIDVRIIAATNKNLAEMCKSKEFREDLYYRLNVIPLTIPPLRERTDDILPLAKYFLHKYSQMLGKEVTDFSPEAANLLLVHRWPGNVREIENVIEYIVNVAQGSLILPEDFPPLFQSLIHAKEQASEKETLKANVEKYENLVLNKYLQDLENGSISREELAKKLGISRTSLYRKLKKLETESST
ncbi:MAG: sigma 54-interacting transcriptional regulator [Firmicutes bacterium]|nr:sigma 54-interacting transcriptional regulator [Bacillota bacterium]